MTIHNSSVIHSERKQLGGTSTLPSIKGLNIYGSRNAFFFSIGKQIYFARGVTLKVDNQRKRIIAQALKAPKKFRAEVIRCRR